MDRSFRSVERHKEIFTEGGTGSVRSKIIAAMDAAGYYYDELESTDDQLRFLGEYGTIMFMDSWKEAKE